MQTKTYEEVLNETGTLCWRTVGVSMRPLIREGKDMIMIRKLSNPPQKYDLVSFCRPGVTGRGAYVRLWFAPYPLRFFILKYKSYPRRAASKLLRMIKQTRPH